MDEEDITYKLAAHNLPCNGFFDPLAMVLIPPDTEKEHNSRESSSELPLQGNESEPAIHPT